MITAEEIKRTIETSVPAATAHITDPNHDGQHFEAIVVSPVFSGLPLVKQHQMVLKIVKEKYGENIHALRLKTFTPQTWAEVKHLYHF